MNFAGKWMYLENIILSEVTQYQSDMHDMYSIKLDITHKIQNSHYVLHRHKEAKPERRLKQ